MTGKVARVVRRLSPLDAAFLMIERRETPMHVAALQIYSLPADAPPDFVKSIVQRFRLPWLAASPWNLKLADVALSRVAPAVVETSEIDYEYHVRHSALPQPGGERELGELISHLHGVVLDRSRPLWTCHVIEGLHENRFAIYLKIHHALADGLRCLDMLVRSLAPKTGGEPRAPWHPDPEVAATAKQGSDADGARLSVSEWKRAFVHAFGPLLWRKREREREREMMTRPFDAPRSILNGPVTNARRVATQQLDLNRVKILAKRAGVSLNDVFLAVCSAALRRHLQSQDALPNRGLVAAVPISLRPEGDVTSANAVAFSWATLASNVADPRERLFAIHTSTDAAKRHLKSIPIPARPLITTIIATPATLVGILGLSDLMPPPMNLVISNVPGPSAPLYLGSARLEALYPISIPMQGQVLNITCVSYAGRLNIGFTGSRDGLPHLQRLAVFAQESLDELEAAIEQIPIQAERDERQGP